MPNYASYVVFGLLLRRRYAIFFGGGLFSGTDAMLVMRCLG